MKCAILAVFGIVGCASADAPILFVDARGVGVDEQDYPDSGPIEEGLPDARADAQQVPMAGDAHPCQVMTRQLLTNPALDLNPIGIGWVQQNIDDLSPAVTADDGIVEQSAPYKAWMGGFAGVDKGATSLSDALYQDVAVPAGTTQLQFTGYYEVRTTETAATVYDTAQVALVQTNGTPIETLRSLTNTATTIAWTAVSYNVAANLSNQTVRLRFTTTNDVTNATSFYFDTMALTATYCQ